MYLATIEAWIQYVKILYIIRMCDMIGKSVEELGVYVQGKEQT